LYYLCRAAGAYQ